MTKCFAEILFDRLGNKTIEVYCGDIGIERHYNQESVTMKQTIRGVLVDAIGEMLVLQVFDEINHSSNLVYLNAWNIKTVVEPQNNMSVIDIYSHEHSRIKK